MYIIVLYMYKSEHGLNTIYIQNGTHVVKQKNNIYLKIIYLTDIEITSQISTRSIIVIENLNFYTDKS